MKSATKRQSRAAQTQEIKVLFYRSANWRQSFVPMNPSLRLDLSSVASDQVNGPGKGRLTRPKSRFHKLKQTLTSLNKVKQTSKKNRKQGLFNKASASKASTR